MAWPGWARHGVARQRKTRVLLILFRRGDLWT